MVGLFTDHKSINEAITENEKWDQEEGKKNNGEKHTSQERPQTAEGVTEMTEKQQCWWQQVSWEEKEFQENLGNGKGAQLAMRIDKLAGLFKSS